MTKIVAITVCFGFGDVLKIALRENQNYFKRWYIVTDRSDFVTQQICSEYENVRTIFYNFSNTGYVFNKGGAIKRAQRHAYLHFPTAWYLLLDADIVLSSSFEDFKETINNLPKNLLYGSYSRQDYKTFYDFQNGSNAIFYNHENLVHGYFQLYKSWKFCNESKDASAYDLEFAQEFKGTSLLHSFKCLHLGLKGNWSGKNKPWFEIE